MLVLEHQRAGAQFCELHLQPSAQLAFIVLEVKNVRLIQKSHKQRVADFAKSSAPSGFANNSPLATETNHTAQMTASTKLRNGMPPHWQAVQSVDYQDHQP